MSDQPDEPLTSRQRLVNAAGWSALQSWGARVISLLVFVLLARLLAPKDFGLVALALVFITLIQTIVEQSFGEAIIQRRDLTDEHLHTAFWTNGAIGLLLTLVVAASAGAIASLLGEPELTPIVRWLSICCLAAGFTSVPQALLQRSLGYKALAVRAMTATMVSGVVAVVCAFAGLGVWSLVVQNIVYATLALYLVWRACDWAPRWCFSSQSALELGHFALHSLGARIGDFLNTRLFDMLIGLYLGATALGYYSVGFKLVTILNQMLTQVTTQISLSAFSRLQSEPARMLRAFYEATQLTCFFAVPAFVALSLLAPVLVPMLFGEVWRPAIPQMQILAWLGVIFALGNLFATVAAATGRPDLRLYLIMSRVVLGVALFFALVDRGLNAIAFGYTLSAAVAIPLGLLIARRLIGVEFGTYLRTVLPMLGGGVAMIASSWLLLAGDLYSGLPPLAQLALHGVIIGICYLATVLSLERSLLKRIVSIGRMIVGRAG